MLFSLPATSLSSPEYMQQSMVQLALESLYPGSPGVGTKNGSCLLCHSTASGGPGNINSSFGFDFRNTAQTLGYVKNGASLVAIGSPSLAEIFSEPDFANFDSDGDGKSNSEEFAANTDPADNINSTTGSGGGSCGTIKIHNTGFSTGMTLLFLLPLLAVFVFRKKQLPQANFK